MGRTPLFRFGIVGRQPDVYHMSAKQTAAVTNC